MRCPDGSLLAAWVDDEVQPATGSAVDAHLQGCGRCAGLVRRERHVRRRTRALSAGPEPTPDEALLRTLLGVPSAEHSRAAAQRRARGTGPSSRLTGRSVGVGLGAGLAAVALLAPFPGAAGPGPAGVVGGPAQPAPTPAVTRPSAPDARGMTGAATGTGTPPAAGANAVPVLWAGAQR